MREHHAVRPAAAEVASGPRPLWRMMPRCPRGVNMGSPTGVCTERRKVANSTRGVWPSRGGQLSPAAARRRPPPPARRLLP